VPITGHDTYINVFDEAPLDEFQQCVIRTLPNLIVEYLDFNRPGIAGGVYGLPQLAQLDNTLTLMARPMRRGTGQSDTWKPTILSAKRSI
jgi:hypothetical protein